MEETKQPVMGGMLRPVEGQTVEALLDALKEFIEEDLKDYRLPVKQDGWKGQPLQRPIKVHSLVMPDPDEKHERIPYILLQPLNGKDGLTPGGQSEAEASVRIVVTLFNRDKREGRIQLLHIIERLRMDLIGKTVIGKTFELKLPMEWLIYPDEMEWYHLGEISTTWSLPAPERKVPELRW